jgi:hypothetical protein
MTPAGVASRNNGGGNARQVVAAIPFTAAAHEHQEPAFTRGPTLLTANAQQLDTIDLPAFGFLRHIYLDVTCTGGVGGTLAADAPFNIIQSLTLLDVNGAPLSVRWTGSRCIGRTSPAATRAHPMRATFRASSAARRTRLSGAHSQSKSRTTTGLVRSRIRTARRRIR